MKKKNNHYFLLTILGLCFQTVSPAIADSVSTPDPVIQNFPNIIINEVSFKDSVQDWMELYIKDDMNSRNGANIKGLKVIDDSAFFTITNDFLVHSGDYLVLNFKSETENFSDSGNLITFNIKRSGLTGTTEQVVIKNSSNEIIDAVCWVNSSPTESEISDFAEVSEENQWSQNISTCIPSETVPNNNSVYRKTLIDTNSNTDWAIQASPTKGKTNISAIVQTTAATPDPVSANSSPFISNNITNDDDDDSEESNTVKSINTCESIYISEFLPNPDGTDTGNEWIELYNPDDQCIMDGWLIDDLEGGSKPFYIYNKEVLSNGFLLLPSWETKISLNNSEDSVRLFNNSNEQKEKIDYKNAKENFSYAKNTENKFEWTSGITPLSKNLFMEAEEVDAEEDDDESAAKTSKSTTKKSVAKGDLSENIFINEIFPNPKGTDKGGEWIEIYNNSDEDINLGGWYLDLGENSTKKYIFDKTLINSHAYLVLSDTDMGLTLKNTDGEIRLLDYEDKIIDSILFESAAENSSYTKIKIISGTNEEYEWKWTTNLTKAEENQTLYKYKGKITLLDEKSGSFELTLPENNEKVSAKFIQAGDNPLMQELKIGAETEMIFSKTDSGEFILEDFQILQEPQENADPNSSGIVYILLSSLPPAGVLGYFGVKKLGLIKFITT